jgi:hypothetical protein
MIQALQDALRRKTAYRRVFLADTDEARLVLRDIMRQVLPRTSLLCPGKQDVTDANCGAHSLAAGILRTIYSSDEDLKKQIEELYRQENQQP